MSYEIAWERPFGVREQFRGVLTPDDVARAVESLTSDAGFDDLRYVIVDLLDANGHSFDVRTLSALEVPYATLIGAAHTNPHIHVAFLVGGGELRELVELKIARGVFPHPAQVFNSEAEARDWLGGFSGKFRRPVVS